MTLLAERAGMGKKKMGRPKTSKRDDVAVKMDRMLVNLAKLIAARRKVPLAELLSELVRIPLERAHERMLREYDAKKKPEEDNPQ